MQNSLYRSLVDWNYELILLGASVSFSANADYTFIDLGMLKRFYWLLALMGKAVHGY